MGWRGKRILGLKKKEGIGGEEVEGGEIYGDGGRVRRVGEKIKIVVKERKRKDFGGRGKRRGKKIKRLGKKEAKWSNWEGEVGEGEGEEEKRRGWRRRREEDGEGEAKKMEREKRRRRRRRRRDGEGEEEKMAEKTMGITKERFIYAMVHLTHSSLSCLEPELAQPTLTGAQPIGVYRLALTRNFR